MSDSDEASPSIGGITCWCGRTGVEDVLGVGRPALAVRTRCPDHGLAARPGVGLWELIDRLEQGIERSTRWPDLAAATLFVALISAGLPVPTLVVDTEADAVFANPSWGALTGLAATASHGQGWLSGLRADQRGSARRAVARGARVTVEVDADGSGGTPWLVQPQPIMGEHGGLLGHVLALVQDRRERIPAEPATRPRAEPVTGPARDDLLARISRALETCRGSDRTVAVTVLQVEPDLPEEPDAPGLSSSPAPFTDAELGELTRRIRSIDGAGSATALGEARVVVVDTTTSYAETVRIAEQMVAEAERPFPRHTSRGPVRASAGVAFPHFPAHSPSTVLGDAERALELAWAAGGRVETVIGSGPGSSDAADAADARPVAPLG